ncbi:MAG TPA: type II secretion system F family protein [Planctomycetaceae bacterium]|nr:type II secretion system F family protein [Planctomycetaceae bacterium]
MLLAELINFADLVPLAVFGAFAALAWWVLDMIASSRPRTLERLEEFSDPAMRRKRKGKDTLALKKEDAMTRVLEKASQPLAKPLTPKSEMERSRLKVKLANAGFRGENAPNIFLSLKFAGLLVGLFIGGGALLGTSGVNNQSLMTTVMVAGFCFYLPDMVVWFIGKNRKENVFLGLPDALDLMVVCVEAGLGLDQAMRKVAEEMKNTYRVIAEEFALANFQLQMGRPRAEVLHELGVRTGVSDVRSLVAVLIQADKFGSSIAQALRVQSDSMRTRRRQLAEEKAAKTAVKLIFPLVMFIFPGIFVVLVGPAAITMIRELFPKMAGG